MENETDTPPSDLALRLARFVREGVDVVLEVAPDADRDAVERTFEDAAVDVLAMLGDTSLAGDASQQTPAKPFAAMHPDYKLPETD